MRIHRSKEWWLARIDEEPDDAVIGAGAPDAEPKALSAILLVFLTLRAKAAGLWRLGLIKRTTAFRWEMDLALGEWT